MLNLRGSGFSIMLQMLVGPTPPSSPLSDKDMATQWVAAFAAEDLAMWHRSWWWRSAHSRKPLQHRDFSPFGRLIITTAGGRTLGEKRDLAVARKALHDRVRQEALMGAGTPEKVLDVATATAAWIAQEYHEVIDLFLAALQSTEGLSMKSARTIIGEQENKRQEAKRGPISYIGYQFHKPKNNK
jgi:hypothetical protein